MPPAGEAGQPGQQLRERNVASDREVVLEGERQQRIRPGPLREAGPLCLLPALIGTGVGGVEEQGQQRQIPACGPCEGGLQDPLVEVEADDVARPPREPGPRSRLLQPRSNTN